MMQVASSAPEIKSDALFKQALASYEAGQLRQAMSMLDGGDDAWFANAYPYLHEIRLKLMAGLQEGSPDWTAIKEADRSASARFALLHPSPSLPDTEDDFGVHNDEAEHHYLDGPGDDGDEDSWMKSVEGLPGDSGSENESTKLRGRRSDLKVGGRLIEGESADAPTSTQGTIERTPHIGLTETTPLQPGARFSIRVYLDTSEQLPEETGRSLLVADGSVVEATLVTSSHFWLEKDRTTTSFVVRSGDLRTEVGTFWATVAPMERWTDGIAFVGALFFVDGRPCGKVTREVQVAGQDAASTASKKDDVIAVASNGGPVADLTVTIIADPANDGRSYYCFVSTPHLDQYRQRVMKPWNLQSSTQQLVRGFMDRFTASAVPREQLISELRGSGVILFKSSPEIFQEVFWALIDGKKPLETIAIVSAEPFVPWELMVPTRSLPKYEQRLPLGVEFCIGRWTDEKTIAPSRTLNIVDSSVIAPAYSGSMILKNSLPEAQMVVAQYPGEIIRPAPFATVGKELGTVSRSLIHFVCHGKDMASGIQCIRLDNGEELSSANILGIAGLGQLFATKRPVVFLNACEVGRTTPSLVGLGGFVASFINLGATAVIAPLWSVEDAIAHEIAVEFYRETKNNPTRRLSDIFKKIRTKGYDPDSGKDTYVAYCFYGDPGARLSGVETS
ncbi:hypothetical protein ACVWW6_001334 [Bradyrhizobium sp. USDA 3311]